MRFSDIAMADDWSADLRTFRLVAASPTFSAAARTAGVEPSTIARAIRRMEDGLGFALLVRSTREVTLTEAGRRYLEHVGRWLLEEDAMRADLSPSGQADTGVLRVSVPVAVAELALAEVVADFRERLPRARLHIHATDEVADLVAEGVDLAIRMGPLTDSTLSARRIAGFRRVICASPGFLEQYPTPREPGDLASLPCLLYTHRWRQLPWELQRAGRTVSVEVDGPCTSNNTTFLRSMAEIGLGVARLPDWVVRESIEQGRLVPLLSAWRDEAEVAGLYAVYPRDPGRAKLRGAFLAALDAHIATRGARLRDIAVDRGLPAVALRPAKTVGSPAPARRARRSTRR